MVVGCIGSVVPVLPGTPLVLAAAVAHRLYFGSAGANYWVLGVLLFLTLASIALDYLASAIGAKKLGATWRGILGAIIGGLIGLLFGLPGIVLGPFLGALLLEMLGGYKLEKASRAGLGAVLGLLVGAAGKFAISVVMTILFAVNVIYRSSAA